MSKQVNNGKTASKSTKPTKPTKSVAGVKAAQKKFEDMKARLSSAGDLIGKAYQSVEQIKTACITEVGAILKAAMKAGLTVDELKASTANVARPYYDALAKPMDAAGISAATRDNYMSRIRAFVKDRGANPLDLYGNLAKAAQLKAKSAPRGAQAPTSETGKSSAELATEQNQGSTKNKAVQRGVAEKLIGLPALQMMLAAWLEANPTVAGSNEKPINKARDMVIDVQDFLTDVLKQK